MSSLANDSLLSIVGAARLTLWERRQGETARNPADLFLCRRDCNFSEQDVTVFTTLKIDRSGQPFVTIQRPAGYTWDFLSVDNRLTILHNGDGAAHKCDVEGLPLIGFARQLWRGSDESVNAAGMMAGRLLDRICFYLDFIATAQINSAIRVLPDIELNVQLEILELGVIDKLGAMSGADQRSIFNPPWRGCVGFVLSPAAEIFAIEQLDGLSPFRCAGAFERRGAHAGP